MENELIKTIVSQGGMGGAFVWLLIDTRKESKDREANLQSIINKNQEVILIYKIYLKKELKL